MITVWCTFQFEGWHCWPDAPDAFTYLRNSHRHMFHVRAEVSVEHDNRDVEFIEMKRYLEAFATGLESEFVGGPRYPTSLSCEMMAALFVDEIRRVYGPRQVVVVTVSEDGENGATVERISHG